ncbi:MAG: hypothetical protein BRC29_03515 [Nanohaloarchaea archaeon SW_7_43_1]|nr:MAG: hypothetical protein BRC29_03515 [Nanohaloarchaea archaeon SW_7_43_1]
MENLPEEVTKSQAEALKVLWDNKGEIVTSRKVAQERDTTERAAEGLLKRMAPDLITIDDSGNSNIYTFSDTGREIAEEMFEDATPYGNSNVRMDVRRSSSEGSKRLHGVTIQAQVQGSSMLPDEWYGVLQEKEDVSWISTQDNDYQMARDIWILRFHKDAVTFQLRKDCSIRGTSSSKLIRKLHQKTEKISSWIEDVAGVSLQCRYFINRAELAFENLPEAQLADDLPGIPLSRFKTIDPDLQEQVFKLDASPGFPEGEAQGPNFERIAQALEAQQQQYAVNYQAHENRIDFENTMEQEGLDGSQAVQEIQKVSTIQEQMGETVTEVESLEKKVSDMETLLENQVKTTRELQETRKSEKKTRDALMEQVRSVNNLAQSNQELLQENVPQLHSTLEVVPHQTQLIEKLVSRVEEMEEKIENMASSEVEDPVSSEEVGGSSLPGQGMEEEEGRETRLKVPNKAELVRIEISTSDDGSSESMFEELPEYAVDPSILERGFRFKDLREDLLLEVQEIELQEKDDSFLDMVSVRVAGSFRIWNKMPRNELARLLGTGRFEIVDPSGRSSSSQVEEEESGSDDSLIVEEDSSSDSDAYYF